MVFIKLLIITFFAFSKSSLLELTTRQNVHNLKLNSSSGVTFYLKGKKSLAYSAKNKAKEIIRVETNSEFDVVQINENNFLISIIEDRYKKQSFSDIAKIYLFNLKNSKLTYVDSGSYPKLHPSKNYFTFSKIENSKLVIHVINSMNTLDRFMIPLKTQNLLYQSNIEVIDDDKVYYTDLTSDFKQYLSLYNHRAKKNYLILMNKNTNENINICTNSSSLIILKSNRGDNSFTSLNQLSFDDIDFSKGKPLFNTSIGPSYNLLCRDKEVFFIKTIKSQLTSLRNKRELVSLDLETNKLFIRTDLKFLSSFLLHQDQILVPFKDKVYVLKNKAGNYIINTEIASSIK